MSDIKDKIPSALLTNYHLTQLEYMLRNVVIISKIMKNVLMKKEINLINVIKFILCGFQELL